MVRKISRDRVLIRPNLTSAGLLVLIDVISCVDEFLKLSYSGMKLYLLTIVGLRHAIQLDALSFQPILNRIHAVVMGCKQINHLILGHMLAILGRVRVGS